MLVLTLISGQSIVMGFVPILHELPIFGLHAAKEWLWTVDLSPGFLGQGIIIGPFISPPYVDWRYSRMGDLVTLRQAPRLGTWECG